MLKRRHATHAVLAMAAAAVFVLPASSASAGTSTVTNACANSVTANFSQISVTTSGDDGLTTVAPAGATVTSGITQSAAIPGAIFVAGYNLGLLVVGPNNIPANVRSTIEATNTADLDPIAPGIQNSQNTNVVGGAPPNGSVTVSTTITDPDGTPGTGDETGTDASFSVTYNNLNWTAGASGTIDYRQQSIATWPATNANNTLLINALVGGIFNVTFRCAPATVTPPDPGTVALIDPAASFDTTLIQEPEPQRQISIDNVSVAEGNSGQTPAQFTVSLNAASANPVTVDFATANGTATAPGDYASNSGTVTFAPGDTSETVTVQVNGDTAVEPNETFDVNLSNATGNSTILDGTGVGTITNDDVAASDISISNASATEGAAESFTVSLSAPQAAAVTVDFATANGSAVAPGDYTSATGTVTFAPGDTSETVTVQTIDDALVEGTETFDVNLSNVGGNAAIADGLGVGTILDNDVEPQRQISIDNVSVAEGNSGQTPAQFTVSLNAASANPVTVDFATANGTATAPGDYASNSGTVTFAPGDTSETVTVQVNGDTAVEPNETFDVNLSNATGNSTILDGTGVGTITNDDVAASDISISNASATEGAAESFTVSLSAPQAAAVTVDFATANGSAVAPGDYTAATGTVTFAPGDTSETVTVQTIDDALVEGTETFDVNLSNVGGNAAIADGLGVGTILDNDVAEPQRQISIDNASATEGGAESFTVSLDAPSANPVTVDFATANGSAVAPGDYTAATGTVTFAPGDTSETVTVQTIDDALVEGTETFDVNLSNVGGNAAIADGLGVGTILDNDVAEPQRQISISNTSATEGAAENFTVSLNAASANPVTVDFATANGSAVAPGDYTAATGTVTFAPGDTSETVSVTTIDDALVEGPETFDVNLSNATGNATIADGLGVGTINDNDGTSVSNACANSLSPNLSQIEVITSGDDGLTTVAAGGATTTSNLTQSAAIPGAIFAAGYNLGAIASPGQNNIPVNVQTKIEATNTVEGTQTTNTVGGTPPNGSVFVTTVISDPDGTRGTGDESATNASFSVNYDDLNWTAGASGTIEYRQESIGTAPPTAANNTLLINAQVGPFPVQFRCAPGTVAPPAPGTISLIDPAASFDTTQIEAAEPQRQISIDNASATEGGAESFTVSLDAPSANPVTVDFATANGSAVAPGDYTAATGTVTFAPGDTSETVTVQTIDDALVEGTETFDVNLSNVGGNAAIADGLGVGTILDNDVAEPQRQISISNTSATEGAAENFTVSLNAASANPVTVDFATANGTATAPGDYTSATGTVTFAPGDTSETVSVTTIDDALVEGPETFDVNLSNATGNATIADGLGVGTINDNDGTSVSNACANSLSPNLSQIEVITSGDDGLTTVAAGGATTTSNLTQSAAIPGAIFAAGYNLGAIASPGQNNIPVNVQTKIEATNTVEGTQTTNTVGGTPPNGSVFVTTVISDPDGTRGTGDESATNASFSVNYDDLNWTAGASGTIEYRQESIGTAPPTAANNTLLINAQVGPFPVQFRCAPGTVAPPAPGTISLIDPAASFDTTQIEAAEPQRQISIDNASATEGGAESFTVSLDAPSANPVTVDFATANGSAVAPGDYTAATGTVTFAPGDTSETVTVQTIDDALVEGTETFDVNLSNVGGNAAIADGLGVGTILDNDVAEPQRQISISNTSATEGAAENFTVSLNAASANPVTVDFATANGTATAPGDYTSATGTVTFAPGDTSETVSVTTIDDALVEGPETFDVNLSNATGNATIADGLGVGTINDNDGTSVSNACANSLSPNLSQIEVITSGDDGLTTVAAGGATTTSNLTQSAAIPGAIFAAGYNLGAIASPGQNNIPVNVQTKIEATNTVEGTQTTNTVGGTPPNGSVFVTTVISDPDGTRGTGDESATNASFSVNYDDLNWTAGASGTIEYRQESIGTAPPTAANNTLLINAQVGPFPVQFRCAPGTVAPPAPGTISLIDPAASFDTTQIEAAEPQRQISIDNASATEGGAENFTVSLDAASANPVTVDYATANNTAVAPGDYTAATGTVTFAPGDTSETVTVQTIDDTDVEGLETFVVNLSNATGNAAILDATGVGTILDNDVAEPQRQISISNTSATEGAAENFTVSLNAASANPVTVDFATANNTAVAPGDYTAATGTVTFAPGDTSETVTVQTIDDTDVEGLETFVVNLSNATGNAAILDATGVGTILDNDVAEPQRKISINDVTKAEGNSGQTPFVFTVSLNAASANPITVAFATANGTATAPGDYASNSGTVTFAPGDTSKTVTVQVNGDTAVEPDETFDVNLSNATGNATILDGTGVGTITNDDAVGKSKISINDVTKAEGNSGQTPFVFTVSLSAPQAAPVTVKFATANGTATAPSDYASNSGTVTFAPGETSKTVTVQVKGDTAVEPNETFKVNLSYATGNATILDGTGVGTITNDDAAVVDAAGKVIVVGDVFDLGKKDIKAYALKVTNVGNSKITVNPSNIDARVEVNGSPNGSVQMLPIPWKLDPGQSALIPLLWTGNVVPGDSVKFIGCVNLAGDTNTANNCDSVTLTARALPHHGGH